MLAAFYGFNSLVFDSSILFWRGFFFSVSSGSTLVRSSDSTITLFVAQALLFFEEADGIVAILFIVSSDPLYWVVTPFWSTLESLTGSFEVEMDLEDLRAVFDSFFSAFSLPLESRLRFYFSFLVSFFCFFSY